MLEKTNKFAPPFSKINTEKFAKKNFNFIHIELDHTHHDF